MVPCVSKLKDHNEKAKNQPDLNDESPAACSFLALKIVWMIEGKALKITGWIPVDA